MERREFLKYAGALGAQSLIASGFIESLFISTAHGQTVPVKSLKAALNTKEAMILVPTDANFAKYQGAFNKRTLLTPSVRVLCATWQAVAGVIQWAQANKVPMAIRGGGHSYEGFSQTTGVVIDTRPMNSLVMSADKNLIYVGSGANLGSIYSELAKHGRAIPAGTCGSVGVTGHTTGGGYGLLARTLGLACDSLEAVELVNARGELVTASHSQNQDLFWALRGGGNGSFGVITRLAFRTHKVSNVVVFGMSWNVDANLAKEFMTTWQAWAPQAPREINSILKASRGKNSSVNLRFIGLSAGSETTLSREISALTNLKAAEKFTIKPMSFIDSVMRFGGNVETSATSVFMKGKSDYLKQPMSDQGLSTFFKHIPSGVDVIFDGYGGAVSDLRDSDTAFAHRDNTVCSLQYYSQWSTASESSLKLQILRQFHSVMRPYVSGSAYVNYCDLDINNWAEAYWGKNLDRLTKIKSFYDPENIFKHAQSVPLKAK